jgi:hypothetical protein
MLPNVLPWRSAKTPHEFGLPRSILMRPIPNSSDLHQNRFAGRSLCYIDDIAFVTEAKDSIFIRLNKSHN